MLAEYKLTGLPNNTLYKAYDFGGMGLAPRRDRDWGDAVSCRSVVSDAIFW